MKLLKAITFAFSFSAALSMKDIVHAQALPLRVGMNYGEARNNLIQQGWQPHVPYKGLGDNEDARSFIKREITLRKAFRDQGWYEAVHCYPTGAAWCFHSFTNVSGKELVVQTGSGAYGEVPNVIKFYFAQ